MAFKLTDLGNRAKSIAKQPRTRKIGIWIVSIIVAIGVIGALIAPPLVRQKLASELSKTLHREVSIQQIRINPYTMSATVRGFLVKERQGGGTALSFDELYANLQLSSLFRLAPVLKEIKLVKPYLSLVRNEDLTYNFTDLIEEFTKGPSGPTPRFSLNNIEIVDGRIDFDDRPEKVKHEVTSLRIGVPFISSILSYVDIYVQPTFSAVVDGSPMEINGQSKPFKDSHETTVHLDIDQLHIPKYIEYSPVDLNFKVPSGQLDGKLTASFKTAKNAPSVLAISGNIALKELLLQMKDDAPIFKLPALDVALDSVEIFARRAGIKSIKIQGPELYVTRSRTGELNLASLVVASGNEKASPDKPEPKEEQKPFGYRIDEVTVDQGKVFFTDRRPEHPFEKRLENIHTDVKGLTNEPQKKATTEVSFQTDAKEDFNYRGELQLTPVLCDGQIEIKNLQLKGLRPYYESLLGVEITEGFLDFTTRVGVAQKDDNKLETRLSELNAALRSLRLDVPGDREPLWRTPLLAIKDTTVDIEKKSIVVGSLESRDGNFSFHRNPDGTFTFARVMKTQPGASEIKRPEKEDAAEWLVQMTRMALDRFRITFEDRMLSPVPRLTVSTLSVRAENTSNAKNARGKVRIQATINDKGRLRLAGALGTRPVGGRLEVDAQGIEVVPFQPYLADQVSFSLTGGAVGTKGILNIETGGDGAAKVNYEGGVQVTDFASVEKDGSQDLLKWKSLDLGGIQFSLQPMQLRINEITFAEFYARMILGADGKLNLQKLAVQKTAAGEANETKPANPAEPAGATPSGEKQVSIGKINLRGGNVYFSDFFVKPNYSANLTGVEGSISELKPETPGDIAIQAKLDNAAPVDIAGKINPLSKDLYLDIAADAREIELNPMSPYSVKYVGYGIERGKLSFKVKYRLEHRKLEAENQIILDQLTFGERVESPTATKLPVLLAVALLKDRNGVIDVNLPISGSLDNPEFSVGGIILRIIINIITRAVTSPFALLGAAFGGGSGGELSYIEFDYGRSNLTQSAEAKIKTIATAMNNRPALKLDISGRVDPVNDLEGLKRLSVERKIKAQKMKELVGQGAAPKSVDEVQISSEEYPRFLWAAYKQEDFPKERNVIGLTKELPVPQMEKLMLEHAKVEDADLSELANRRAQAVRDYLLDSGKVGSDRLSLVASKPSSGDEKDKAKAKQSRVDFSLR